MVTNNNNSLPPYPPCRAFPAVKHNGGGDLGPLYVVNPIDYIKFGHKILGGACAACCDFAGVDKGLEYTRKTK